MIGRTNTGGGGGGAGVNFRVFGGTVAPAVPRENDIWVETSEKIVAYYFSNEEPTHAEQGVIWFPTGVDYTVEFNALKKNGLQVYPFGAKQFISGDWKSWNGYIYRGGEWVQFALEWDYHYFKDGDLYEEITGGWTSGTYGSSGKATIGNTLAVSASSNGHWGQIYTVDPVDLSKANTIWIDSPNGKNNVVYPGYLYICTEPNSGTKVAEIVINVSGKKSIDVSSLNGSYYLMVRTQAGSSGSAYGDVRAIWME